LHRSGATPCASLTGVLFTPLGKYQKFAMIQCADCGVPVGAIDPSAELALAALRNQVAAIDEGFTTDRQRASTVRLHLTPRPPSS
jgi:hypothetical protein